jgi:hypothetical protein
MQGPHFLGTKIVKGPIDVGDHFSNRQFVPILGNLTTHIVVMKWYYVTKIFLTYCEKKFKFKLKKKLFGFRNMKEKFEKVI